MAINIGSKYFKTEGEILKEIIVIKFQNKDVVSCLTSDHYYIEKINVNDIENEYTLLKPDGILTASIVSISGGKHHDVIIALYRTNGEETNDNKPYCVCRQCITDIFANQLRSSASKVYYGMSMSIDSCPIDVDYAIMLTCDDIEYSQNISIYKEYKLSDILSLIRNISKFDNVLYDNFNTHVKNETKNLGSFVYGQKIKLPQLDGYCKTLESLLEYNNFMYDFYRGFDIYPLDFDNLDGINNGDNGCSLTKEQMKMLSDILCKNIYSTLVIKYGRDIDFKTVKNYVLISDVHQNIYVVAYKYTDDYLVPVDKVETEDNIININDIMKSGNKNDQSIRAAYNKIIFNKNKYN